MSKRSFNESPLVLIQSEEEPQAKRPNLDSFISNKIVFKTVFPENADFKSSSNDQNTKPSSLNGGPDEKDAALEERRCPLSVDKNQSVNNTLTYAFARRHETDMVDPKQKLKGDQPWTSQASVVDLGAEDKTPKSNATFDDVLDSFGKTHGRSMSESNYQNIEVSPAVVRKTSINDVEADGQSSNLNAECNDAWLPQMIQNPKALMRAKMEKEILPLSQQRLKVYKGKCSPKPTNSESDGADNEEEPASADAGRRSGKPIGIAPSSTTGKPEKATKMEPTTSPMGQKVPPQGCCIIEKLISRFEMDTFQPLSDSELMGYITLGRPTPPITGLGVTQNLYSHHVWITGCPTLEKLYCWVCLLFTAKQIPKTQTSLWVKEGFKAMSKLGVSMTKHIMSSPHRGAICYKDQLIERGLIPKLMPGGNLNLERSGDMTNQMIERSLRLRSIKTPGNTKALQLTAGKGQNVETKIIPKRDREEMIPVPVQNFGRAFKNDWEPYQPYGEISLEGILNRKSPVQMPPMNEAIGQSTKTQALHNEISLQGILSKGPVQTPSYPTINESTNIQTVHSKKSGQILNNKNPAQAPSVNPTIGQSCKIQTLHRGKAVEPMSNTPSPVTPLVNPTFGTSSKHEMVYPEKSSKQSSNKSSLQTKSINQTPGPSHGPQYVIPQKEVITVTSSPGEKIGALMHSEKVGVPPVHKHGDISKNLNGTSVSKRDPKFEYLQLKEELKKKESTLRTQTQPPPLLTVPTDETRYKRKADLTALRQEFFPNGTFNGNETERAKIIASGRPTPEMPGMVQKMNDGVTLYFSKKYYETFPWMCGSSELNRIHCWPCLIFSDHLSNNAWNTVGFNNLANLSQAAKIHSSNPTHLKLWMRLKIVEAHAKTPKSAADPANLKQTIHRKRSLLKYLIDAVCFKMKLLDNENVAVGDYNNFLTMLSSHDAKLKSLIDPQSDEYMADFTPKLAENFSEVATKAVAMILQRKIVGEVRNSSYVSFMLKTYKNNIALNLRYAKSTGVINERFYKIIKVGFGQHEALLKAVLAAANELKCSPKVVGISFDGGVLRPDQMELFNSNLRKELRAAYFFHHRGDNFEKLLQQNLGHSPHCKAFFQLVVDFGRFLQENVRVVERLIRESNSGPGGQGWDLKAGIVWTIHSHYQDILKFFDQVLDVSLAPAWTNHVVSQCAKFSKFFKLKETRLLLVFFSAVSSNLHPIIEAFQKEFDVKYWKMSVATVYNAILRAEFEECKRLAETLIGTREALSPDDRSKLMTIFTETKMWVLEFIKFHTKYLDVWAYYDFTMNRTDSIFTNAGKSPQFLSDLSVCFPLLDCQQLCFSLNVAFNDPTFRNKTPNEIVKLMVDWDFKTIFPELHRYLLIIQTVPLFADVGESVAARLDSYAEGKSHLKTENVLLCLEKDLLSSARDDEYFYKDVITKIWELKRPDKLIDPLK